MSPLATECCRSYAARIKCRKHSCHLCKELSELWPQESSSGGRPGVFPEKISARELFMHPGKVKSIWCIIGAFCWVTCGILRGRFSCSGNCWSWCDFISSSCRFLVPIVHRNWFDAASVIHVTNASIFYPQYLIHHNLIRALARIIYFTGQFLKRWRCLGASDCRKVWIFFKLGIKLGPGAIPVYLGHIHVEYLDSSFHAFLRTTWRVCKTYCGWLKSVIEPPMSVNHNSERLQLDMNVISNGNLTDTSNLLRGDVSHDSKVLAWSGSYCTMISDSVNDEKHAAMKSHDFAKQASFGTGQAIVVLNSSSGFSRVTCHLVWCSIYFIMESLTIVRPL